MSSRDLRSPAWPARVDRQRVGARDRQGPGYRRIFDFRSGARVRAVGWSGDGRCPSAPARATGIGGRPSRCHLR
ncbi:MAG: hypothetical protein MZV63_19430 [Marinilabiliales bacterium]|nr:hypothetical protein [Marinilabiliales bacterium]